MAEISSPHSATIAAIYAHHEASRANYESEGLPISKLGDECERALWYAFRWASHPEKIDGRKIRLFETGDREETRMLGELRAIGCDLSGEQERVSACGGHLRGKIDARATGLPDAPKAEHIIECKTFSAANWRAVVKHGVAKHKPSHHAQMQLYMHLTGLSRALYLAHNKDTDELHVERVKYDAVFCMQQIARAERIIAADAPPSKVSDKSDYFLCKFCPCRAQCHEGEMPRRNCRTCLHSSAVNGGWHCALHDKALSRSDQKLACGKHLFTPAIIPGEQIDCDETAMTVTYRLVSGETWIDGNDA